jgi:hypothetical protein
MSIALGFPVTEYLSKLPGGVYDTDTTVYY